MASTKDAVKARKVSDDIWIFSRPFTRFGILPLGGRSVAVRLHNGSVLVVASTPPTEETQKAINSLGTVAYVVSLNEDHHWFLGPFKEAYPAAKLLGPGPLAEKRKDLKFDSLFSKDAPDTVHGFEDDITVIPFLGTVLNDIAFYHKASKTLIVGDLVYNLPNNESMPGALNFLYKSFSPGGALHKKLIAGSVRDRDSVVASAKQVDALDIQRIIPLHGGKAKKTRKFAAVKRLLSPKDARLKENKVKQAKREAEAKEKAVKRL
ncbi:hypothetical protein FRC17_002455 [Serendipita sp. 399]|nr:hypothetical protein FRC17_002455 [Serendipita sp. 399]